MEMEFSIALALLKQGHKIARQGWNGKGMFLFLVEEWRLGARDPGPGEKSVPWGLAPFIAMKTADDKIVPWLASQTDILADDWVEVR